MWFIFFSYIYIEGYYKKIWIFLELSLLYNSRTTPPPKHTHTYYMIMLKLEWDEGSELFGLSLRGSLWSQHFCKIYTGKQRHEVAVCHAAWGWGWSGHTGSWCPEHRWDPAGLGRLVNWVQCKQLVGSRTRSRAGDLDLLPGLLVVPWAMLQVHSFL